MATVEYTRSKGKKLTYTITSTKHGGYTVLLGGKVIKAMHIGDYFGRPRWGSKKLEAEGIEAGKSAVENLMTDEG